MSQSSRQPRNWRRLVSSMEGRRTARKRPSPAAATSPTTAELTSRRQAWSWASTISARDWVVSAPRARAVTTSSVCELSDTGWWVESVASRRARTASMPMARPTPPASTARGRGTRRFRDRDGDEGGDQGEDGIEGIRPPGEGDQPWPARQNAGRSWALSEAGASRNHRISHGRRGRGASGTGRGPRREHHGTTGSAVAGAAERSAVAGAAEEQAELGAVRGGSITEPPDQPWPARRNDQPGPAWRNGRRNWARAGAGASRNHRSSRGRRGGGACGSGRRRRRGRPGPGP